MIRMEDLMVGNFAFGVLNGERKCFSVTDIMTREPSPTRMIFSEDEEISPLGVLVSEGAIEGIPVTVDMLKRIGFEEFGDYLPLKRKFYRYWDKDKKYKLEVYDVDEEVKKETKVWRVVMNFDNFKVYECSAEFWGDGWGSHMKDTFEYNLNWKHEELIHLYIEADCMDRAIKIASERIAQIKANKDMLYAKAFTKVQDLFFKYSTSYPTVYYKTGEIMTRP